mmetsp:Transcript_16660/g.30984  ORF Transcript_16660/g.30984 Transcript_16660/m.30984 type:complete len:224 (+) Transcript_16660:108-779(+)
MTFTWPLLIFTFLSTARASQDVDDTLTFLQTTLTNGRSLNHSSPQLESMPGRMLKAVPWPRDMNRSSWIGSWSNKLLGKVKEVYHFQFEKPTTGELCRESYMMPCLVFVIVVSPNFAFLCVAIVQLITHTILITSNFHCDVFTWCNLTALAFGIFYLAMGTYSLVKQQDDKDLDVNEAGHFQMDLRVGYFRSRLLAGFICLVGVYIILSHGIAVVTGGENPIL